MMEQRRLAEDTPKYLETHRQTQRKLKVAKSKKMQENCQQIEDLQKKKVLEDVNEGISVNGKRLNNIQYADDTIIMADSLRELLQLMTRVKDVSGDCNLDISLC
ncbi:hypothetical protein Trydic_g20327 [Trypoxylus dichotomus]